MKYKIVKNYRGYTKVWPYAVFSKEPGWLKNWLLVDLCGTEHAALKVLAEQVARSAPPSVRYYDEYGGQEF